MITQHLSSTPRADASPDAAVEAVPVELSKDAAALLPERPNVSVQRGSGSVAHQIIDQFLDELGKDAATEEIASNLRNVVFSGKPSELELKIALFGI